MAAVQLGLDPLTGQQDAAAADVLSAQVAALLINQPWVSVATPGVDWVSTSPLRIGNATGFTNNLQVCGTQGQGFRVWRWQLRAAGGTPGTFGGKPAGKGAPPHNHSPVSPYTGAQLS